MRKGLAALLLAFCLAGCSVNATFVGAVDGYAGVILPEYEIYLKADPRLDPDSKRIRLETVRRFRLLIEEAKKE
jgi:hypothetical protein